MTDTAAHIAADLDDYDRGRAAAGDHTKPGPETDPVQAPEEAQELTAFLAAVDQADDVDWLIPDALARRDRAIITGEEGVGKMTLMRQIGVQTAAGIHPFTLADIPPLRVLIIDVQDAAEQVRPELRPLHAAAAQQYKPIPGLHIVCRPEGLDLLDDADDKTWFHAVVAATHPDLLAIGPVYRLAGGDPTTEIVGRAVAAHLDRARAELGCAILVEAHTPHAPIGGKAPRPKRPYGWSGWMRWPEIGLHLAKTGQLEHWRPTRGPRQWPAALTRGGTWPWTASASPRPDDGGQDWPPARAKLYGALQAADGEPRISRELVDWVKQTHGHGLSRETVSRELNALLDAGLVDRLDPGVGLANLWTLIKTEGDVNL